MSIRSRLELLFQQQLQDAHLADTCERELVFAPPRKWRFDFAFPGPKLALEIEGGIYTGGAHGRAWGIERDIEKGNAAVLAGWRVLRATNHMVEDGRAIALVSQALRLNSPDPTAVNAARLVVKNSGRFVRLGAGNSDHGITEPMAYAAVRVAGAYLSGQGSAESSG